MRQGALQSTRGRNVGGISPLPVPTIGWVPQGFKGMWLLLELLLAMASAQFIEELEMLQRNVSEVMHVSRSPPDPCAHAEIEKHLQFLMEVISAKVVFMKSCASVAMRTSFFGLEHVFLDAAKSLVWKDKRVSLKKRH